MKVSDFKSAALFSILSIGCSAPVQADAPQEWQAAATGCTPYHDAIAQDLFSNANGRVRFKPGKTGTIWLACNIPGPIKPLNAADPNDRYLSVTYQLRSDDRVSNVAVFAELKAVSKVTGQITNMLKVGLDVQNLPMWLGSDVTTVSNKLPRGMTFDFKKNYYYVIITLRRVSTQLEPTVFGVALTGRPVSINNE